MTGTEAPTRHGSSTVTNDVAIRVDPVYRADHSDPLAGRYVFAYSIRIANESDNPVTLISRQWVIVDADANRHDVEGEGVVGRQPTIQPGESFEYSSHCPLNTPWGTMEGHFRFLAHDATHFDAAIARFYLVSDES
jgi:ApaG protein